MSSNDELITQFKDVTGVADDRARFYLESANWQLQIALSSFFEGGDQDQMEVENIPVSSDDDDIGPVNVKANVKFPPVKGSSALSDTSNKTDAFKKSASSAGSIGKPKIATLHNMAKPPSDDEEEQGQAFYAGGSERSGQQVLGPPKKKNFREHLTEMFRMAQESGAAVESHEPVPSTSRRDLYQGAGLRLGQTDSDHQIVSGSGERPSRPQNQSVEPVILKLWSQGFSINDGELRPYEDPENRDFLETVMKGQIPAELRQMGNMVSVDLEDHRHEDYKKTSTKVKTFKGSGHTLGSPAPNVEESIPEDTLAPKRENIEKPVVDSSEPTTMIQIRLSDGTRLSAQFNHSHTIEDIRHYIIAERPQYENQNFTLVTSFPTKELNDVTQTIKDAGLLNASLMQRLK